MKSPKIGEIWDSGNGELDLVLNVCEVSSEACLEAIGPDTLHELTLDKSRHRRKTKMFETFRLTCFSSLEDNHFYVLPTDEDVKWVWKKMGG